MHYKGKRPRAKSPIAAILAVAAVVAALITLCSLLLNNQISSGELATAAAEPSVLKADDKKAQDEQQDEKTEEENTAAATALSETQDAARTAAAEEKAAAENAAAEKAAQEAAAKEAAKDAAIPAGSTTAVKAVGLVNASDVNMRSGASANDSVLCILSGNTAVSVLGSKGPWYNVSYAGKTGYVSADYLTVKASAAFTGTAKVTADALNMRSSAASSGSVVCQLVSGSYVDVTGFENGWYAVTSGGSKGYVSGEYLALGLSRPAVKQETKTADATAAASVAVSGSGTGYEVAVTAQQYLGYSYSYGGAGPSSFDCSGFTMYIYSLYGVSLPHGATGQYGYGTAVSQSELQPGDLVFFSYGGDAIGHVGIYIGDRNFVHASTYGVGVITSSLDSGNYPSRYVGARRLL